MYRKGTMALAVAAALGLTHGATAQTQDELRALREQVRQLDKRVQEAEATAQQAAVQASSRPTGENAMNPAVSVILNGIYSNLSQDRTRSGSTDLRRRWARSGRAFAV